MAAVMRRPLAPRSQYPVSTLPAVAVKSPLATRKALGGISNLKRPRSPDATASRTTADGASKRLRATNLGKEREQPVGRDKENEKKRRRAEQDEEFRVKYSKAFPSWTFYFDVAGGEKETFSQRVLSLNANITNFFSNEVTHFITNKPVPNHDTSSNKENSSAKAKSALQSPIKLRGGALDDINTSYDPLVKKAHQLGIKIWDISKLDSVLNRCLVLAPPTTHASHSMTRSLTRLLESERRHGTTSERDPSQRRHDYRYFAKNSYFVLVEDITQQLATIAAMEYPITRMVDGHEKGSWPVLYCHPLARGPFIKYNEREERKREKQDRLDREKDEECAKVARRSKLKLDIAQRHPYRTTDLRRSVSMNNLQKAARDDVSPIETTTFEPLDSGVRNGEASNFNSAAASGYLAASGNSVGITSTYGTTSTVNSSTMRGPNVGGLAQNSSLPVSLRGRLPNEVLWSRRASTVDHDEKVADRDADKECENAVVPGTATGSGSKGGSGQSKEKASASSMMPPPDVVPLRVGRLRKSKSTNTVRLEKRDEKTKPGYCESCRVKFDDFKTHIGSRKHRKFADNESNFAELDCLLSRVRRLTRREVIDAERALEESRKRDVLERDQREDTHSDDALGADDDTIMSLNELLGDDEEEDEILLSPRKRRPGGRKEEHEDYFMD